MDLHRDIYDELAKIRAMTDYAVLILSKGSVSALDSEHRLLLADLVTQGFRNLEFNGIWCDGTRKRLTKLFPSLSKVVRLHIDHGQEFLHGILMQEALRPKIVPTNQRYKSPRQKGRNFLEVGIRSWVRKHKIKTPVVILLDVDRMHQINDRHGFEIGNKVLEVTERVLPNVFPKLFCKAGICGDDTFYYAYDAGKKASSKAFDLSVVDGISGELSRYEWSMLSNGLWVSLSIRVAFGHEDTPQEDPRDIVIRAALGLREAQRRGGNTIRQGPLRLTFSPVRDYRTALLWS